MGSPGPDDFSFELVGTEENPFIGYNSADDPTRLSPRHMVRGTQNVFLENTGNIDNRCGIKRYDPADDTQDPVVSSFDWEDRQGNTLLIRVLESGKMQFYRDGTWYTIHTFDRTDFSYAKWWSQANAVEFLIMVNGDHNLYAWSGGISDGVGAVNDGNSIFIDMGVFLTSFSFDSLPDDESVSATVAFKGGGQGEAAIVLEENPTSGFIIISLASATPALSETAFIEFVNVLSAPAVPEAAQVLIGVSKEATAANLLALLQDPGADTATQMGFANTDVVTLLDFATYSIVPALESGSSLTWAEQGFINNGSIIINDVEYTYDLVAGRYLVNISGTPPENVFGFSGLTITENTPSEDFSNDFILVLNNQLIVCSTLSRLIYISSAQDLEFSTGYTDFINGGDQVFGDPDIVTIDEFPSGGATKGDSAYIGAGTNVWYEITPNTSAGVGVPIGTADDLQYVYTKKTKFPGTGLSAPLNHNFVATLFEDIIYVSQDHQLRTLGIYRNIVQQKSPALSIDVRAELQSVDFAGGHLRTVGEYTYLVAPVPGVTFLYQIRDDVDDVGNITAGRKWQPPQLWNISRIAVVDGLVHGYSAETPQLYQLFDTAIFHDETSVEGVIAPYTSRLRFAYGHFGEREKLGSFDKTYYEGYLAPYTDLQAKIYNDYRGATATQEKVISSSETHPVFFTDSGVVLIGGELIGDALIGGGILDPNYPQNLPKFRAILNLKKEDCFEYQLELFSEELDSQWSILALGANASQITGKPTWLQLQV